MKISPFKHGCLLSASAVLGAVLLTTGSGRADEVLAAWDVSGSTGYGTSPLTPSSSAANTTIVGLTRGTGVGTTGTAAARAWGGVGWPSTSAAAAVTDNKFVTFSIAATAGFKVSYTTIDRFDYRRSNSGPTDGILQFDVGNTGTFTDIQSLSYASGNGGASISAIDLTALPALQNVPAATPVVFRIVNFAGGAAGTWYVYDVANTTAADLSIRGTVVPDGAPAPTITSFAPTSGGPGTAVTITGTNFGASPSVSFNGTPAPGAVATGGTSIVVNVPVGATTGPITVIAAGSVTSSNSFTVIAQPSLTVTLNAGAVLEDAGPTATSGTVSTSVAPVANLTVNLASSDLTEATVPATVTILAGQTTSNSFDVAAIADGVVDANANVTITATAAGHNPGTAVLQVQNVDIPPPTATKVVVNKYMNSPDLIELLVIAGNTPNSTVDMSGMIIKDYSGSMAGDGGGKFTFNSIPFFQAVKAGTLITLTTTSSSPDTDASDFTLILGVLDATYFTPPASGSLNIAAVEMVSIKSSGSSLNGSTGAIHTLAGGSPGTQYTDAPEPKLIATGSTDAGFGVIANNSTSSLGDFNGTDATGAVALTAENFGRANNFTNNAYIRQLRGLTGLNGAGLGSITNATPASPLEGKNIFRRSLPNQSVAIQIISDALPGVISSVRITVPTAFGVPTAPNVTVTGTGAGTPSVGVVGQDITVNGLAISTTNPAVVTIGGLAAPNPNLITDDGRYPFAMQTAGTGGTLTTAVGSPVAIVTIPIENLRDITVDGLALDTDKVVAIEGVCTEANFNAAASTNAYVENAEYGINIFSSSLNLGLVRDHKYVITGPVGQFNGLTEIIVSSLGNVVDLGGATAPTPLVLGITDLLSNAEAYEGRLIKINGLSLGSGSWAAGAPIVLTDGVNTIDVRILAGSTAATPTPIFPASITGILGQADTASPFTSAYQLLPRDAADLAGTAPASYASWIATKFPGNNNPAVIGFNADPDGDGITNGIEYAFASEPGTGNPSPLLVVTATSLGRIDFTHHRAKNLPVGVVITYEWSSDLTTWIVDGGFDGVGTVVTFATDGVDTNGLDFDVVTAHSSLAEGAPKKVFIRAKVTSP